MIYEETIEAKKEGADLKFSIKLSVRRRAVLNKERDLTQSSFRGVLRVLSPCKQNPHKHGVIRL